VFAVAHLGFPDDLRENAADGEVEAAAVVGGDPLGEAQEIWREGGFLIEEGEDGANAAHIGFLEDGEDGPSDGAMPERDANAVTWFERIAPRVGDAVVEDVTGCVIELDFCKEAARSFEFKRRFGEGIAGFLAGHRRGGGLIYAKKGGLDDKDFGYAVRGFGIGHDWGGGMGVGEVAGCGVHVGAVVMF